MIIKNMLTLNLPVSICYQYSKVKQNQIEQHIWKKYSIVFNAKLQPTKGSLPDCFSQAGSAKLN
jgi:hypothetical protein